jgi:energy-converting hydrogenase Eha subunit C
VTVVDKVIDPYTLCHALSLLRIRYLCFRENQRLRYLDVTVVDKVIDPITLCHALSLLRIRYLCFRENQRLRYLDVTVVDKVTDPNTLCHALSLSLMYTIPLFQGEPKTEGPGCDCGGQGQGH